MTLPAAETLEREKDKLYLTDAELIRRIGVPDKTMRSILPGLETKYGFPQKSKLFGGRRYWPAVKDWLDRHNGLTVPDSQLSGGIGNEKPEATQNRERPRPRLART